MQKIVILIATSFVMSSFAYAAAPIQVSGIAKMSHALVNSNSSVKGPLYADHSNFNGNLTVTSDKAVLSATNVKGLVTLKSTKKNPILELRCGTHIAGGVTFEGLAGVVKKSATANMSGKVVNGTVEIMTSEKCE